MNTPRTKAPKRFDPDSWRRQFEEAPIKGGEFSQAIDNPDVARQFALLVTEFTHLEHWMEVFAARLLGTENEVASHVMRSIVSAKARIEMLRAVLERARFNRTKPDEFDAILDEFYTVNKFRNRYVHARYVTDVRTGQVWWIPPKDDPLLLDFSAYKPLDVSEIEELRDRMLDLLKRFMLAVMRDIEQVPLPEHTPPD